MFFQRVGRSKTNTHAQKHRDFEILDRLWFSITTLQRLLINRCFKTRISFSPRISLTFTRTLSYRLNLRALRIKYTSSDITDSLWLDTHHKYSALLHLKILWKPGIYRRGRFKCSLFDFTHRVVCKKVEIAKFQHPNFVTRFVQNHISSLSLSQNK